jgi:TonB-linked SusC/RagA family outer membrane protein
MRTNVLKLFIVCAVFLVQASYAQEIIVNGVVKDNSGLPLPGVNVVVKGSTNGVQTDIDGKFSLQAAAGQTLVFSFVGMLTREIVATPNMNVILSEDAQTLEGVVVTALGVKREKASIGAASTTVRSKELEQGGQNNIADALKGKVAGVVISNASTDPGASSGVIIRGFSSLSGSNQPLYIVDGVPINDQTNYSDDLNGGYDFGRGSQDINSDDIESLTVLKGASATAIYGSRAANGVILITTKKGKAGKLVVDFSTTTFYTSILRTPNYQSEFGQGFDGQHRLDENGSWGPRFDGLPRPWGHVVNNSQKIKPYSFQKDQLENFFDTGTSRVNNLSLSGGSGETTVRLSYSNTQQDGIYPTDADSFERNTLGLSGTSKVGKVTLTGSLNYVNTAGSAVASGQGLSAMNDLMQIPTDLPITEFKDYRDPFNNVSNYYTPYGITNPYFTLNENGSAYSKERVYGSFEVNAEINKWSHLIYRFGLDQFSDHLRMWTAEVAPLPGSYNFGQSEQEGTYAESSNTIKQINHEVLYDLNFDLGHKFGLASTFGYNINVRSGTSFSGSVGSQDIPGFYSFSNSSDVATVVSSRNSRKLYGVYNSSTLSYNEQLYLTGNIRNDWYSTLPKANQSVLYGGVNGSWIFTNTFPGIKNVINYGKFRAGYGVTGVDTDPYQVLPVFVAGSADNQGFGLYNYPVNGVNGYEVGNRLENLDLRPERRKEFEVGLEASFFKNRISVDLTYYDARVVDQILSIPLAPSSGYTSQTANVGTISNKGFEGLLTIAWVKHEEGGFNWSSTINYATNNTILEKLDPRLQQVDLGGLSTTSFVAKEGQPIGLIMGSVPERDPNGNIVVDASGIPIASPIKQVYGDTQYDYTMGVGNTFSYKGITLDFSFDIRQGGLMYSRTADITRFTGNSITTMYNDRQPFVVPHSVVANSDGTYSPNNVAVDTDHMDDYYRADALARSTVIDKSFIKLREVVLSYTMPLKYLDGTHLQGLTFSLIGRNLFLWTPRSNQYIDPETSTFGTDLTGQFGEFSASPSTRSIGFSLKTTF